eukprot:688935-Pelagomonas_calceolata.AAC.5
MAVHTRASSSSVAKARSNSSGNKNNDNSIKHNLQSAKRPSRGGVEPVIADASWQPLERMKTEGLERVT